LRITRGEVGPKTTRQLRVYYPGYHMSFEAVVGGRDVRAGLRTGRDHAVRGFEIVEMRVLPRGRGARRASIEATGYRPPAP
jgi:hypothetical protein